MVLQILCIVFKKNQKVCLFHFGYVYVKGLDCICRGWISIQRDYIPILGYPPPCRILHRSLFLLPFH